MVVLVVVLKAVPAGQGHAVVAAAVGLVLALTLLPQGILLVRRGQTLGKWMMGIAIRRPDGSLARPARILHRRAIPVGVLIHRRAWGLSEGPRDRDADPRRLPHPSSATGW